MDIVTDTSSAIGNSQGVRDNLVSLMYEIAVSPLAFDSLLSVWDATLKKNAQTLDAPPPIGERFLRHAFRAKEILSRLEPDHLTEPLPSIRTEIELDPNSIVVLSLTGTPLFTNAAFGSAFGASDPKAVGKWLSEASYGNEWTKLQARLLAKDVRENTILGVLQIQNSNSEGRSLFLLKRAHCPVNDQVGAMLCAVNPVWDEAASAALQHHFGLTEAEIAIAKLIVSGTDVQEIARARTTSVQTVRTQIKSLLTKAGFRSKIDLVRHFGSLRDARWCPNETEYTAAATASKKNLTGRNPLYCLQSVSGIRIDYTLIGPEDGDPVLFLHGIIDSLMMSEAIKSLLHDRGLRLIVPVRPHFGGSGGYQAHMIPCQSFADIVVELLDALGLGTVPVIGHMAGVLYAYHLADLYPERVSHIVGVAGAVPMTERWQFDGMSTGHRIAGLTARHVPRMLPLLIQGGIQLVRVGKSNFMLKLMFRDAPEDLALATSGGMHSIMLDRFRFVTAQGYKAFEIEVCQVSDDWSDLANRIHHPIGLVHGQKDCVVLIEGVIAFASNKNARLVVSETSGQLVLNDKPQMVFDMLETLQKDIKMKKSEG